MDNDRLNQLFNEARSQAPKASFDQTKDRFINSIHSGGATTSTSFFNTKLFKTILMMTSSIVVIGISLFIWNKAPNETNVTNNRSLAVENQSVEKVKSIQPHEIKINEISRVINKYI